MITVFNRSLLFVDANSEAAASVWSALEANGIEYEMRTKQNVSTLRTDTPDYVYIIYVKKRDLPKAREICHL